MKLSTAELKKLKSNSYFIKKNNIIPILGYLKFDNGYITKHNLSSFIIQKSDFKGSLLVDETILFNFINYTTEKYIEITSTEKEIIISDGKSKVKTPIEPISNFPSIEYTEEGSISLDNDVLCAINNASNFTVVLENVADHRSHVFVGEKLVAACNAFIGYTQKFKEELPKIVLSKEVAQVVGKFNTALFTENERWILFDVGETKYGFIKPINPYMNLNHLNEIKDKSNTFEINKSEILLFSEMCITSVKTQGLLASMVIKENKLIMSMNEPTFGININKEIEVIGKMEKVFNFNPALMSTLLKNIPDEQLSFYRNDNDIYYITGKTGFVSMILPMFNN